MANMSKRSDLALLLLLFKNLNNRIAGRKRLQKTVCILKYKYGIEFSFMFRKYFYGPYSYELQNAIDTLRAAGLIAEEGELILPDGYLRYNYELTDEGKALASKIVEKLGESEIGEQLRISLASLSDMSTDDMVLLAKRAS